MENIVAGIVLGHLAGDYLFQTRSMALLKSEKNFKGFMVCFLHCAIYTLCVCLFIGRFDLSAVTIIFLSHFPIDYWSLGQKWLDMIKGRNLVSAYFSKEEYHEIDLIFSCIVYTITDNTLHIMIMYLFFG